MTNEQEQALENLRNAIQQCEDIFKGVWIQPETTTYYRVTGVLVDEDDCVLLGDY